MPAASRWRRYSTPVATATARASTSVAPASCSTRASTVIARQPSRWAHSRTRSARGARSGVVPSRAAAPNGSRPRLPPTDSRSADEVEQGAGRGRLVGDRRDDDRGEVEAHVGEHLGQVGHGHAVVADVHPHRGDAVLEVVEHGGAGHGGVRVVVQLAHVPRGRRVAQGAAAGERHRARAPRGRGPRAGRGRRPRGRPRGGGAGRPRPAAPSRRASSARPLLSTAATRRCQSSRPCSGKPAARPEVRPEGLARGSVRGSGRPTRPSSCSLSDGAPAAVPARPPVPRTRRSGRPSMAVSGRDGPVTSPWLQPSGAGAGAHRELGTPRGPRDRRAGGVAEPGRVRRGRSGRTPPRARAAGPRRRRPRSARTAPAAVAATECSQCAARDRSRVATVHSSSSTMLSWSPSATIGSMQIVVPSTTFGPLPLTR